MTAHAIGGGEGGGKADASRKAMGVGSKPTDPAVGAEEEKDKGGVKVEVEGEGGKKEGDDDDDDDDGQEAGGKGKYSRRKIVDNSWRYEEPEEDPYLKGWPFHALKVPFVTAAPRRFLVLSATPDNSELMPYRIISTGRGRPRARARLRSHDHRQSPAKR